jgi:hypothetical protein
MDMELPEDAASAIKLMSLKKEVMASVLSAGVRVNDTALRKKGEDKVAKLLAKVKGKVEEVPEPPVSDDPVYNELFG